MSTIRTLNKWANHHFVVPMTIFRIIFGAFLFYKGIQFESQTQIIIDLVNPLGIESGEMLVVHYVSMVHLAGGILVMFGLITRLALFFQLPIFLGAVVINAINHVEPFIMTQAIFGLIATLLFLAYGSGRVSVDYKLQMEW